MTIIKLNLKGSKYASTPYASHLDLSFKIQFEDAQRGLFVFPSPPIHNYWRYSTSHPKEQYVLCKHITPTADRRLKVFGTQKNKLKVINKSSLGLKTAWKAISISDITKDKLAFCVCFFIWKFLQGLKCTVCENECEISIVCGYCIGFVWEWSRFFF